MNVLAFFNFSKANINSQVLSFSSLLCLHPSWGTFWEMLRRLGMLQAWLKCPRPEDLASIQARESWVAASSVSGVLVVISWRRKLSLFIAFSLVSVCYQFGSLCLFLAEMPQQHRIFLTWARCLWDAILLWSLWSSPPCQASCLLTVIPALSSPSSAFPESPHPWSWWMELINTQFLCQVVKEEIISTQVTFAAL